MNSPRDTESSDSDDESPSRIESLTNKFEPVDRKHLGVKLGVVAVIACLVYLWRPLFHYVIYNTLFTVTGAVFFGGTTILALFYFLTPPFDTSDRSDSNYELKLISLAIFALVLLLIGSVAGIPAGWGEGASLATSTMSTTEQIDDLPQTNPENPRIVPRAVADKQTRGSTSYRQHQLGPSDIARAEDGDLTWSYAIQPDQFMNQLRANQRGVLLSGMTRMENRSITAYDNQEFTYGQNMLLHRGAKWNLLKGDYFVQYQDDPVEFTHDGEAYMQYPKTGHEWRLLPFPHTVPTWEGNALVHQNGTIEHLSPTEAQNNAVLDGQRLYPLHNSEMRAESLRYRNGIVNQLPALGQYINVVIPADMPAGTGNSQPFVIDLQGEQLSYVYAMEPPGGSSSGLDEVWFFNADTGASQHFGTGDETVFGPERAMGLIRSEDSRTGWGENFEVVEPVPTSIDGELYWHAKVVPVDNTDVSRSAFVNAHDGTVVQFESTANIREFIREADINNLPEDSDTDTEPAPEQPDVAYYVVITDSDGNEINRIPVEPGEEITIEQP